MTHILTPEFLEKAKACAAGLESFVEQFPNGLILSAENIEIALEAGHPVDFILSLFPTEDRELISKEMSIADQKLSRDYTKAYRRERARVLADWAEREWERLERRVSAGLVDGRPEVAREPITDPYATLVGSFASPIAEGRPITEENLAAARERLEGRIFSPNALLAIARGEAAAAAAPVLGRWTAHINEDVSTRSVVAMVGRENAPMRDHIRISGRSDIALLIQQAAGRLCDYLESLTPDHQVGRSYTIPRLGSLDLETESGVGEMDAITESPMQGEHPARRLGVGDLVRRLSGRTITQSEADALSRAAHQRVR